MPIPADEVEDAMSAIRNHGLDEDVFTFEWIPYNQISRGIHPVTADVKVTNTMTGQEKEYAAGDGTAWVLEFTRDLAAGEFSAGRS